jgi:iron(III) transport system substrate-binding protein
MKKHVKAVCALSLTGLLLFSLSGCGGEQKAPAKPASKKLTVYWGALEDYMAADVAAFEKATGIKVTAVRMSSGETLQRLKDEKNAPKASVWFGGPADGQIQAKADGLLEKYVSPNAKIIPNQFKDADGFWTGVYVGYLGFASNGKLLKEKNLEPPKSWNDLLKPEYQGQIMMPNPKTSGTGYTLLASMFQLRGEEDALEYMKKLDKQIKAYQKSGSAPAKMAGQGECMIGISFLHDAIKFREGGMKDLVLTYPVEGTGYEVGAVSLIKGGPDQDAAKLFIDWCLTAKAQEIGQTVGSYQFLTHPHAKPPQQAGELSGTKLIKYNFLWAGRHRDEVVYKWEKAIGK